MKLLRNNGKVFEIDANEVNEILINILDDMYEDKIKCEITFIADDIKFTKIFDIDTFKRVVSFQEILVYNLNEILNKQLSYHKKYDNDNPLLHRFTFNVEEMFKEALSVSQKEFLTKNPEFINLSNF